LQSVLPEDATAANIHQLTENGGRRFARELRKLGVAGGDIDRRACQDQLCNFAGKTRGID
jgi:hypothetical protein